MTVQLVGDGPIDLLRIDDVTMMSIDSIAPWGDYPVYIDSGWESTKTALFEPLLNASIPRLPDPEKRSRMLRPSKEPNLLARELHNASFTLSAVGLTLLPTGG